MLMSEQNLSDELGLGKYRLTWGGPLDEGLQFLTPPYGTAKYLAGPSVMGPAKSIYDLAGAMSGTATGKGGKAAVSEALQFASGATPGTMLAEQLWEAKANPYREPGSPETRFLLQQTGPYFQKENRWGLSRRAAQKLQHGGRASAIPTAADFLKAAQP